MDGLMKELFNENRGLKESNEKKKALFTGAMKLVDEYAQKIARLEEENEAFKKAIFEDSSCIEQAMDFSVCNECGGKDCVIKDYINKRDGGR